MKKLASLLLVAGAAATLASCSSDGEPTAPGASDITIGVKAPVEEMTRAAVNLPEGYTMHCILQLLDEHNNTVGQQKTADIDAVTGTGTFVITAADQELGVKALFWAEYVDAAGKSVYNTADLKAVGYSTTEFDLADKAAMASTDAFCGKLDVLSDGANVTLRRPFANINFVPNNPEKVADAKKMVVSYTTPAAYNVFNGTAVAETEVKYTNASFNSAETPWFSTFVFAPVDKTALDSEISIALSEGLTQTIVIESGKVPLNPNFQITVSATIGDLELSDININVGVDPGYSKPEFKVGSYVNAAGEPVTAASDAAGIVFFLGAMDGDAIANYDAKFTGKTIKGYAVALHNVEKGRQQLNTDPVTGLSQTTWVNGAQGTEQFLTSFAGSNFANTFSGWVAKNPISGDNVTDWYIPSLVQLTTWLRMLYPSNTGDPATGDDAFKALFPQYPNIFDRENIATVNYASCTINNQGNVSGVRMNGGENPSAQAAGINTATQANQSALCRPMITIFE